MVATPQPAAPIGRPKSNHPARPGINRKSAGEKREALHRSRRPIASRNGTSAGVRLLIPRCPGLVQYEVRRCDIRGVRGRARPGAVQAFICVKGQSERDCHLYLPASASSVHVSAAHEQTCAVRRQLPLGPASLHAGWFGEFTPSSVSPHRSCVHAVLPGEGSRSKRWETQAGQPWRAQSKVASRGPALCAAMAARSAAFARRSVSIHTVEETQHRSASASISLCEPLAGAALR